MTKILFVCHGNICRSPMGEFIMKDMVTRRGIASEFEIASAATSREELGNPIYPPAKRKLAEHDIGTPENDLGVSSKRARQITREDLDYYDLIICMDHNNLRNLARMFGTDASAERPGGKIRLLLDYAGRYDEEVADPWYTGDFDATWDDVISGCEGLLEELQCKRTD